jgi:hypothetical protein
VKKTMQNTKREERRKGKKKRTEYGMNGGRGVERVVTGCLSLQGNYGCSKLPGPSSAFHVLPRCIASGAKEVGEVH